MQVRSPLGAPSVLAVVLFAAGCASARAASSPPAVRPAAPVSQTGTASWYGMEFHGRPTASGEPYDQRGLTAAHRTLPLGTRVRVTNLSNGRAADVRINDRGPFVGDRIIDLSRAAAERLDMIGPGTATVRVDVLDAPVALAAVPAAIEYTVQAGSYAQVANAEELRARLAGAFRDVRVVTVATRDGTRYRVYVGAFAARADADAEAARVRNAGYSAIVVEQ